ncbi:MAG: DUF1592 domain-containing protein [Gammaproteobacteria bacterium]|jgi:hypothetical protein
MLKSMASWTGIALVAFTSVCFAQQESEHTQYSQTLNQYCVSCHNDALMTAGLSLQNMDVKNVGAGGAIWEKVLRKLRARAMPPSGMPRPADATYQSFINYLESNLDLYAKNYPQPGPPSMRRLNRTEYINSISELFALDIDGDKLLPPDDAMFGFDNIGTVLTLSPLLIERYISAARKIRLQAIGNPDIVPSFEYNTLPQALKQDERMNDDMPFGSRGGIAVEHHFPMDGEYVIQVRLQKNYRDYIRGMDNKEHQIDVRMNDERIKLFTIGGEKHGKSSQLFSTAAQGDVVQEKYERFADEALEVRFPAKAGKQMITAAFLQETLLPEGPRIPEYTMYDYTQYKGGNPGVRTLAIGGPFDVRGSGQTASREKIFTCIPGNKNDEACAVEILTKFARNAYRRPPTKKEVNVLLDFYRQGQRKNGFEAGIGIAIERILAGPEFLFLTENVPQSVSPDEVYPLSDLELASRLSIFLWSQIPDDELLTIAESGKLKNPGVLEQQVKRMLDDPRSLALVENFAAQWLTLGKLNVAAPDIEIFPYFDDNLRESFKKETELFIQHILREDRPLLEILTADYTFINERLAKHYEIPNIFGNHFRKVNLPDNTRGGLLGQGSILTVTSYANRTAPTIRGKWILENILGAPPPPPPANVPGLRDKNDAGVILTMRERMEQHRENPVCASCHKVMDPLGFALENYDAIGKWRTTDSASSAAIDSTGALPDGTAFEGPVGLRSVLMEKRQNDFIFTTVEKLMTYALGREIMHTDAPIIRSIIKETKPDEHSLSSLIMSVINSTPYQMRRVSNRDDI